jgi:integrase/recombinase XerD
MLGVSAKIIDPIHKYLSLRKTANADEPLFVNHSRFKTNERLNIDYVSRLVKRSFRAVGINDSRLTSHSLRHTAAITAIRSGATIQEVKEMLGHSSLETTRIYFSSIEAETRLSNNALRAIDRALDGEPETGQKQPILQ